MADLDLHRENRKITPKSSLADFGSIILLGGLVRHMKIQPFPVLAAVIGMLIGQMESAGLQAQGIAFTNLPSVQALNYKVDPYIKVAGQLQDMGQQAATQQLLKLAKTAATRGLSSLDYEQRTAILCRMLFIPRKGSTFERPAFLGGPSFLGGEALREDQFSVRKNYINWPSEPIEIVDGIPFAVVSGYGYEGIWNPQSAEL